MTSQNLLEEPMHASGPAVRSAATAPAAAPTKDTLRANKQPATTFRRTVRARNAYAFLGAFGLLIPAVHLLHELQVRRSAGAFIALADTSETNQEPRQALYFLNRYRRCVPEDTKIMARYAMLLDDLSTSAKSRHEAVQELEKALRRDPRHDGLRRRVARDCIDLLQYSAAAKHLEILLKAHPDAPELEEMLGKCHAQLGEFGKAVASFEKAIKHDPGRVAVYVQLAGLLETRLGQVERAAKVLEGMLVANPRSVPALIARARFWLAQPDSARAAADLKRARELAPDDAEVLLAEADLAQRAGGSAELQRRIVAYLKLARDVRFYAALARLEFAAGRRQAGIEALRDGLKVMPGQTELLAILAETRIQDGHVGEAARLINEMSKNGGAPEIADYLKARIALHNQDFAAAAQTLQRIHARLAPWPELACQAELELSECCRRLSDTQSELAACRRAVAYMPRSAPARFALASALMSEGVFDAAANEYRLCLTLANPPPDTTLALSQALVQQNLQWAPSHRDWKEADAMLARAEAAAPGSVTGTILRAEVLAGNNEWHKARILLESASAAHPKAVALRIALANLLHRNGKPDEALRILDEAKQRCGDSVDLRIGLAGYWTQRDPSRAAKILVELDAGIESFAAAERVRLLRALAELAYQAGAFKATETICNQIVDMQPQDKRSRLLLFDVALQSGQETMLAKVLRDLHRLEGEDGVLWRCGDAARLLILARRGHTKAGADARLRLAEVSLRLPGWSYVPLLAGILDEIEGKEAGAIDHYLEAIDKGEQRPQVIYRAAELLFHERRLREAQQVMGKLEARLPLSGNQARLAAEIALAVKEPAGALELALKAVRENSADYRDFLWLAQFQEAAGRLSDARATLRKATERGKNVPDTWAALARLVGKTESQDRAEAVLQEAHARLAPERALFARARYLELIGRLDEAEIQYRALLTLGPNDVGTHQALANFYLQADRPAKAEPHLRRLSDQAAVVPVNLRLWARRQLALVLSGDNQPARLHEAATLIDANLAVDSANPQDQRIRAMLLAMQPARRREAFQIIEESSKRRPLSVEEQCRLAQIYEAAGERLRAREQLVALVTVEKPKPAYLALFTRFLARQGELREAQRWLTQLEKIEPDKRETIATRAYVLEMATSNRTQKP